tara:strand:+ start:1615 stop:4563 length:2949 start_codon:yes stop_codon:yes gene_type:complete
MVTEQLIVNGVDIPLEGSLNPNLTYSIQDIKRLDKRKATYSKTITLPSSKVLNDLFNFIFEINIDGTFNPNLKADAVYLVDSQTILNGFIKLNSIDFLDNSMISYKCTLLGSTANFFTDLGEKELTDIQGLGDFNHKWNDIEQRASWDTSIEFQGSPIAFQYGRGYTYPLIDYGKSTDLETFLATDLYPSFYVKELWDRIFADAGFTYTSNFLSSAEKRFKQAIIPFNGDKFGMNSAQIADRMFTADTPSFVDSMTNIGLISNIGYPSKVSYVDVSDPAGLHNAGIFTVPGTGRYNISAAVNLTATFKPTIPAFTLAKANMYIKVTIKIVKYNLAGVASLKGSKVMLIAPDYTQDFQTGDTYSTTVNPSGVDTDYCKDVITAAGVIYPIPRNAPNPTNRLRVEVSDVLLGVGETVKVIVSAKVKQVGVYFLGGPNYPSGTINSQYYNTLSGEGYSGAIDLNIVNTGLFKATQVNTEYAFDDTIDMYGCLPRKIKQKDFVMSIINMFNLFVEPDINNPNNLNIEPREDFYNTEVNDWSKKLDVSNSLMYEPMGLLDASRYIFSYKADKDYYNEKYLESYDDIYGQREIIIDNEFLSNTNTNKIIFSPTPLVGQSSNDRVLSTIIKVDQYQQSKPTASNIRYLIYDGLKDTSTTWIHESAYQLQYPYAGHFDDPFTPTVDVNFGLPFEIYYDATYYTIVITNNNLYNEFHDVQIEEITDKDSKVVKGKFYLTPNDISTLSFKGQYFFNNAYHRLLKVDNYNPSEVALTKCEFLKLKTKDKYTAGTIVVDGGIDAVIGNETVPKMGLYLSNPKDGNSYNTRTTNIQGANNIVDRNAKNVEINGDSNVVSSDTKNIVIQNGSNNTIEGNIENITLINTSNVTVTESNVTYINGEIKGTGSIITVSSSFTADESITTYLCDTSAGDMNISLPATATIGKTWNFKKIAIDKSIRINSASLIDGAANLFIDALNNSYSIQFDGLTYKII